MSSLFTDLKHRNMKDIKRKLEQLTYEIKLVKSDEPDRMTGVMIRLEELTDLVNKLLIPDVINSQKPIEETLSDAIKQSYDKIKDNLEPPL
jgi:archaellum component FlaC